LEENNIKEGTKHFGGPESTKGNQVKEKQTSHAQLPTPEDVRKGELSGGEKRRNPREEMH